MASLKKIKHNAKGIVSTTDGTTWVTLCSYTLTENCSFVLPNIHVIGKDGSGNTAVAIGMNTGKRVSGIITQILGISSLISMASGSDVVLATSDYRINVSGNDIQLQVKGVSATTIEWQGYFEISIN